MYKIFRQKLKKTRKILVSLLGIAVIAGLGGYYAYGTNANGINSQPGSPFQGRDDLYQFIQQSIVADDFSVGAIPARDKGYTRICPAISSEVQENTSEGTLYTTETNISWSDCTPWYYVDLAITEDVFQFSHGDGLNVQDKYSGRSYAAVNFVDNNDNNRILQLVDYGEVLNLVETQSIRYVQDQLCDVDVQGNLRCNDRDNDGVEDEGRGIEDRMDSYIRDVSNRRDKSIEEMNFGGFNLPGAKAENDNFFFITSELTDDVRNSPDANASYTLTGLTCKLTEQGSSEVDPKKVKEECLDYDRSQGPNQVRGSLVVEEIDVSERILDSLPTNSSLSFSNLNLVQDYGAYMYKSGNNTVFTESLILNDVFGSNDDSYYRICELEGVEESNYSELTLSTIYDMCEASGNFSFEKLENGRMFGDEMEMQYYDTTTFQIPALGDEVNGDYDPDIHRQYTDNHFFKTRAQSKEVEERKRWYEAFDTNLITVERDDTNSVLEFTKVGDKYYHQLFQKFQSANPDSPLTPVRIVTILVNDTVLGTLGITQEQMIAKYNNEEKLFGDNEAYEVSGIYQKSFGENEESILVPLPFGFESTSPLFGDIEFPS